MIHEIIDLKLDHSKLGLNKTDYQPKVYTYILDNSPEIDINRKRPTVVICPGGGYVFTSDRESEGIAIKLNSMGFNAVILRYSCKPAIFPTQLMELASTIALVRENAEKWHVDTDKIVVMGFSAGGHLAASIGVHWDKEFVYKALNLNAQDIKPNALVLSYAVVGALENSPSKSYGNLLGDKEAELLDLADVPKHISKNTPKSFIWHTFDDDVVPVKNALMYADGLHRYDVPFELHIYPTGPHGLGLSTEETCGVDGGLIQKECANWIDLAGVFIKNL